MWYFLDRTLEWDIHHQLANNSALLKWVDNVWVSLDQMNFQDLGIPFTHRIQMIHGKANSSLILIPRHLAHGLEV